MKAADAPASAPASASDPAHAPERLRLAGWTRGVGLRIALTAIGTAALAVVIIALGVVAVGGDTFARLMVEHGSSADEARQMFDHSITLVMIAAVIAALLAAGVLAAAMARLIARPLGQLEAAARRVAAGDYSIRVPRSGPAEVSGLAESFNQMAADLGEQERMRREFIANAAHELKTPLSNLKGYLEGLRDGVIAGDAATYASLQEEAERLVRLATSLDLLAEGDSHSSAPQVVEVDLAAAIRTAIDLAMPAFERAGIEPTVEVPARLAVRADPDGLAQILANLFQNAASYTPAGGLVRITAEPRGPASDALVSVVNGGPGIPAADLPHLFERFYRAEKSRDRARGGAGIGLAIVKQLVEAVGGTVGAESTEGHTRFWFTLPT